MNPAPTYTRPPIVEALLDIQVELPGDFRLDKLLKCQQKVKSDYPEMKLKHQNAVRASFGQEVTSSASSRHSGYAFISPDKKQLFQARQDGFTFNRLAPYPGWAEFIAEAQRLWEVYRQIAHPQGYKRVAVRTINKFDFPSPVVRMETFFRTFPELSGDLPQLMEGFFFQFNLPLPEVEAVASITETMIDPPAPGQSSVILDIDLFRIEKLPSGPELWPLFERLRIWKNKVFEASITDDARRMIL